jgi:hypothetical protein
MDRAHIELKLGPHLFEIEETDTGNALGRDEAESRRFQPLHSFHAG